MFNNDMPNFVHHQAMETCNQKKFLLMLVTKSFQWGKVLSHIAIRIKQEILLFNKNYKSKGAKITLFSVSINFRDRKAIGIHPET